MIAVIVIPIVLGVGHAVADGNGVLGTDKPDLFQASDFAEFVADTKSDLGTTKVTEAVIYPDYAVVYAIDPTHPTHVLRYYYDGSYDDGEPDSTLGEDDEVSDLANVDPNVIARLIDQGPGAMDLPDPESRYLIIEAWGDPSQTAVYVYASDDFGRGGYFVAATDGTVLDAYPPEPDE